MSEGIFEVIIIFWSELSEVLVPIAIYFSLSCLNILINLSF